MKFGIALSLLLLSLMACEYNDISPAPRPVREVHYSLSTLFDLSIGQRLGVKTLTYDGNGHLTYEYFAAEANTRSDHEVFYEYDAKGNLVKTKERPSYRDFFQVKEITYRNGLKHSEKEYSGGSDYVTEYLYFYTNTRLDSIQFFTSSSSQQTTNIYTELYQYDGSARLIRKGIRNSSGWSLYQYDDRDNIIALCYDDVEHCTLNDYNAANQKIRVTNRGTWQSDVLMEELFYEGDRLAEKRVHEYPMYGRLDMPLVTQIKYEY